MNIPNMNEYSVYNLIIIVWNLFEFLGIPSPTVFWYLNDERVDTTFHMENGNEVINLISVPNVQRSLHRAKLTCRAHNTHLIEPVLKTVAIELNCEFPSSSCILAF